jgi:hypothetical protein
VAWVCARHVAIAIVVKERDDDCESESVMPSWADGSAADCDDGGGGSLMQRLQH